MPTRPNKLVVQANAVNTGLYFVPFVTGLTKDAKVTSRGAKIEIYPAGIFFLYACEWNPVCFGIGMPRKLYRQKL